MVRVLPHWGFELLRGWVVAAWSRTLTYVEEGYIIKLGHFKQVWIQVGSSCSNLDLGPTQL